MAAIGLNMAMSTLCRACTRCRSLAPVLFRGGDNISTKKQVNAVAQLSTSSSLLRKQKMEDKPEYPADYEVSYDEFKYVEQILPSAVVPEPHQFESYPTPSGWFPPNEEVKSQQKYLVHRTKNHMLPVYPKTSRPWYGVKHVVTVKYIDGDIWALHEDLRAHLMKKTGRKDIRTQVHEVARQIRVSGLYTRHIAEFLLARGM